MTKILFACGTDNDGYPTCQGDGSTCGPPDQCVALIHSKMPEVYDAWRRGERSAVEIVDIVSKGRGTTNDEMIHARVLLRGYGVDPDEIRNPEDGS
jgi:hypothetical protein